MTTKIPRRLLNAVFMLTLLGAAAPLRSDQIIVTTAAELSAALTPFNAGKRILVRAGEYAIGHPLTVPDDATLVGEGEMLFDESGLPTGFEPRGRTVIRSAPTLVGDVLTLGNGATVRGLAIEDATRQALWRGNVVVASSRGPGDFVSALLAECEIVNPNSPGVQPAGPTGRALVAVTRNLNLGQDPPAHEGAVVRVEMRRTIIRSPGGGTGVFAINFASDAEISLILNRSVIDGGLDAAGGVSRPDAVTGSSVSIKSSRNLYSNQSSLPRRGWNLIGGAGAPVPILSAAATSNRLQIHSNDDTIDGFQAGIVAVGGRRYFEAHGPSSSNRLDMNLHGLRVQTTVADLVLFGAESLVPGVAPGDGNLLSVNLRDSAGSGPRANEYADSLMGLGVDNQLEIGGSANAFEQSNDAFVPIPAPEFFTK